MGAYMHDVDFGDEDIGSLLYRKAIRAGATSSVAPYYLAWNLHKEERYGEAYLACLDACVKDPGDEPKLNRLIQYARDAGHIATRRPASELEEELLKASAAGAYPLPLSEEDEEAVVSCFTREPAPELLAEEMSRPPF